MEAVKHLIRFTPGVNRGCCFVAVPVWDKAVWIVCVYHLPLFRVSLQTRADETIYGTCLYVRTQLLAQWHHKPCVFCFQTFSSVWHNVN